MCSSRNLSFSGIKYKRHNIALLGVMLCLLLDTSSGIPEAETFGRKGKFSAFGLRFRPPKLKAEYGRNSRKALDFLLFVHENIANVNYQW